MSDKNYEQIIWDMRKEYSHLKNLEKALPWIRTAIRKQIRSFIVDSADDMPEVDAALDRVFGKPSSKIPPSRA